ncbi:cytochrome P450 [Aspergillus aurantiobrunneus]
MALILLSLPIALCVTFLLSRWQDDSLASVPGPKISKWTGIVLKYHWLIGNRMKYVHALHHRYGPIVRVSPDEVDVTDIAAVKNIHRIGTSFIKSYTFYRTLTLPDIENLFNTSDVQFHSARRRLFSSPASDVELHKSEALIDARVKLAIEKMRAEMQTEAGAVDIFQWWIFMTTDIIGELCFGDSFHMLEYGKNNQYARDLTAVASLESVKVAFPRLVGLAGAIPFPVPYIQQAAHAGARFGQYAVESVQRYKQLLSSSASSAEPMKQTLFTRLFQIHSNKDDENSLPDKAIIDEAITFIVAGSDTTANTLTYLVWTLCQPQNTTLRTQLLSELASLPSSFNDSHLSPLPYLSYVINETLRLYSGVPSALPRVSNQNTILAGHHIPAGTTVTTQAYSLHRDPSIYKDPEIFNPSRWENPTREMKDAFMPFGGGARTCLGIHLAKIELRLATARFFRAFPNPKVDESMKVEDMDQLAWFLLAPKGKKCLIRGE